MCRSGQPARSAPPPAEGQHVNPGHDARPGQPAARAPHRGACRPDRPDRRRPAQAGGDAGMEDGPHQLTCRQAERTFGLVTAALGKQEPGGMPSAALTTVLDDLLEASIPTEHKDTSTALAADWTDVESFSRPRATAAATAPTRHPGDTAPPACPAPKARCSSATTTRPPPQSARKPAPPSRS
jgi:hypothetical protein